MDYYQILNVHKNASTDEIKRAYKKKIVETHPDVGGGNEEKFKEVEKAYRTLSNNESRSIYDLTSLKSFLREKPVVEILHSIDIPLIESLIGCEREIVLNFGKIKCNQCSNSGCSPGTQSVACIMCAGNGSQVDIKSNGQMKVEVCINCLGRKMIPISPCKKCSGKGSFNVEGTFHIKIPRGMSEEQAINFDHIVNDAGVFSVNIAIKIINDEIWSREDNDLKMNYEIDMITAYLGSNRIIINPYGKEIEIQIPPGVQSGDFQFYRGLGVERKNGDLTIIFNVKTPKYRSNRSIKLAQELKEEIENLEEARCENVQS